MKRITPECPPVIRTKNGTPVELLFYLGEYSIIRTEDREEAISIWMLNQFDLHEAIKETK